MKKQTIDSLIHASWVAPVSDKQPSVLENHSIAVNNGKIVELLSTEKACNKYSATQEITRNNHLLIPGLINAHGHAAMTLLRGIADDKPLMTWLEEYIWPLEAKHVNESFVAEGTQLAIAEMLRSGTTTFADMYFFPDIVAREARNAGMRACVGLIVLDFPTVWAQNPTEYIRKGLALHDELKADALIHDFFAPHAPYTVSDEPLHKIRSLSAELGIPIQMHVHETEFEVHSAVEADKQRPLSRLNELGLLTPDFMAVHMTQLNEEDMALVKTTGTHIIHCPESNMKLASGICPAHQLIEHGVNVALGTDGAASNNDLDMLGEMRSAALLAKVSTGDATAINAHTALKMATINGAKALGISDITGSLDKGKAADIVSIDMNHLSTTPVYDPVAQLVYSANQNQVRDVWVNGNLRVHDHKLTGFNEQRLMEQSNRWRDAIAQSLAD